MTERAGKKENSSTKMRDSSSLLKVSCCKSLRLQLHTTQIIILSVNYAYFHLSCETRSINSDHATEKPLLEKIVINHLRCCRFCCWHMSITNRTHFHTRTNRTLTDCAKQKHLSAIRDWKVLKLWSIEKMLNVKKCQKLLMSNLLESFRSSEKKLDRLKVLQLNLFKWLHRKEDFVSVSLGHQLNKILTSMKTCKEFNKLLRLKISAKAIPTSKQRTFLVNLKSFWDERLRRNLMQ